MRQVIQNLASGATELIEVPVPRPSRGQLLIATRATLISAGTERMLVEFGRAGWLAKARQQPDKVKQVLDKVRTDGIVATYEAVSRKLEERLPLGYCNAGVVIEVGTGVRGFSVGDRVVSNGSHAESVAVPQTLCARIPGDLTDEQAAFTVLGSIALQGIRLIGPSLGESVVVYGLGLIGQLAGQMLQASGCRVLGVEVDPDRLALAETRGMEVCDANSADPTTFARAWTGGRGVDGVLICASARTDEIVHNSAQMCRKRGRVVLVGVVGLDLRRSDFYEKELTFQVSSAYGPGRYDPEYELKGHDYPIGFVRWTAQRNFEAVLELLRSKKLFVDDLISHRFPVSQAPQAYEAILNERKVLGVVLQFPGETKTQTTLRVHGSLHGAVRSGKAVVGVVGGGNFARSTLLPALQKAGARVKYIADRKGFPATELARKFGAENATSDYKAILNDPEVSIVILAVGHHLHAPLLVEALDAGKHVLVEKPLALNERQVEAVIAAVRRNPEQTLLVGFNRRFSPHSVKIVEALSGRSEPLTMNYTVNAGVIPDDHWVHDPDRGGGRIIGEACHFIDLMVHLTGALVTKVSAFRAGEQNVRADDRMAITMAFTDGSVGTVNYFANGAKAYPKEILEVFSDGRVARIENFRKTRGFGFRHFSSFATLRQDKGHNSEIAKFLELVEQGGEPPMELSELVNVTLASFGAMASAREGRIVCLAKEYPGLTSP